MSRFLLLLLFFFPTLEARQEAATAEGYRVPILKDSGEPCFPYTMTTFQMWCQQKWERMVRTDRISNQRKKYQQFQRGTVVEAWYCKPQDRFCVLLKGDSCTCSGSGDAPQGWAFPSTYYDAEIEKHGFGPCLLYAARKQKISEMNASEVIELLRPVLSEMMKETKSELSEILPGMSFSERLEVYELIKTSCLEGVKNRQ